MRARAATPHALGLLPTALIVAGPCATDFPPSMGRAAGGRQKATRQHVKRVGRATASLCGSLSRLARFSR